MALALCIAGQAANAEISVTPRLGVYFDNSSQRQSALDYNTPARQQYLDDLAAQLASLNATAATIGIGAMSLKTDPISTAQRGIQVAFPQFGGTVTFSSADSDTTQLALTALYGTATTSAVQTSTQMFHFTGFNSTALDTDVVTTDSQADLSRLDVEATLQHRLNETFSLVGGVRAERTTYEMQLSQIFLETLNFGNLYLNRVNQYLIEHNRAPIATPYYNTDPGAVQWQQNLKVWTYSVRFGAAAYVPVGEKHLFYVNGLLHVSDTPTVRFTRHFANGFAEKGALPSETLLGPDISVGYMYRFSDRFGVDLRYRATIYFPIDGPSDFQDSRVNHGVGIGFTTWLGDR